MAKLIKGLIPPIITCFKEDESIDEEAQRSHVDWLIENGVQGVIPSGSTGEFINMTEDEQKRVIKITIDQANGKVPVFAGTHRHSTKKTIELSKFAEDVGADGVMIVPPYYLLPTRKEIYAHYKAVSEAINIPIMLYNNPWFSGVDVPPEFIAKMGKDGLISYIKEAHGDPNKCQRIIEFCDGTITVYYGHDINAVGAFAIGCEGWVSGLSNTIPKECRELFDLCTQKQDYAKAKELWYKKVFPFAYLCSYTATGERPNWPQFLKEGLELRGRKVGAPRKPLLSLDKEDKQKLKDTLTRIGVLKQ